MTINDKVYSFLTGEDSSCSTEVDNMIGALNNAIRNIFPTVPLQHIIKKVLRFYCLIPEVFKIDFFGVD